MNINSKGHCLQQTKKKLTRVKTQNEKLRKQISRNPQSYPKFSQ